MQFFRFVRSMAVAGSVVFSALASTGVSASPFTMTTPDGAYQLPDGYPEAGGVAFVLVGANGNVYYQFSNPAGAFSGFQNSGSPAAFRGNPFTINNPLTLDCGFSTCSDYFGGAITNMYVRFTAQDGDTAAGNFDHNRIFLIMNGFNVGNWSDVQTQTTNYAGTNVQSTQFGFTNQSGSRYDTGWFSSTNAALLGDILSTGQTTTQVFDQTPNDNNWNFRRGSNLSNDSIVTVAPGYTLEKTSDKTEFLVLNETISYEYIVTNIGSVPINDLSVVDDKIPNVTCDKTTIQDTNPGGTADFATCTATYQVQQEDIDAGFVTNIAQAAGTPEHGQLGTLSDTVTVTGPARNAAFTLSKTAGGGYTNVDDQITYTFEASNTGNVTLTNVEITDPMLGAGVICTIPTVLPGQSGSCTGTYTVDQDDLDAGQIDNTASATATAPAGVPPPIGQDASETVQGPAQVPALSIDKDTSFAGPFTTLNESIPYTFEVTNTGNISITGSISVSDDKLSSVSCPAVPIEGLAPDESITCTGTYSVDQDDLDNGFVTNVASASVTQTVVPQNPGDPTEVTVTSATDTVTVNGTQSPALSILKRVKSGSSASFSAIGDTVIFEYVVTNSGNVTTTDPITVSDDKIPGTLTCTSDPLAPDNSVTCEQTWTATQDDLDAGAVTNLATGDTTYGGNPVQSNTGSVTINAVQDPSLAIEKTFEGTSNPGFFDIGDVLSYTIVVTNDGNVTIDAPITLDDSLTTPDCPAVPGDELLPTQTLTCTATHTVTQNDIDLGSAVNVVNATGTFNGDPVQSPNADALYPVDAQPALTLVKEALAGGPYDDTTDQITYRFTVTNTGNVGLSQAITIEDDKMGTLDCKAAAGGAVPVLGTGQDHVCEFTYDLTQDDLDAGEVVNNATARTLYPATGPQTNVVSPNAMETVATVVNPDLTVAKDMTSLIDAAEAGDTLTYVMTATNTGNQTISGVSLTDSLIPSLTCSLVLEGGDESPAPPNVVLLPGQALSCTGTYEVQQSDVDAQSLVNTATATGTNPAGGTISEEDSHDQPLIGATTTMVVTKSLSPDPGAGPAFIEAGQTVTFVVSVENTGTITLNEAVITDTLMVTPTSCSVGPIAPETENTDCTFTYTVTQDDVNAVNTDGGAPFGGFTNIANVTATPNNATLPEITGSDDVFVPGPVHAPQLTLAKTGDLTQITTLGQTVTYTFEVTNSGNITLTEVPQITDDKIGTFPCTGMPPGGLLPDASYSCTATYTVTQPDMDSANLTNTATVTSSEVPDSPSATDDHSIPVTRAPGIELTKTADATTAAAGETVTYTYVASNTGTTTLTNVSVSDQHTSAAGTVALTIAGDTLSTDAAPADDSVDSDGDGVWTTLAPGDAVTFTATYLVTQEDIDQQVTLANTATVTASSPDGTFPEATAGETVAPEAKDPSLVVEKRVDNSAVGSPAQVNDLVTYTVTVTNDGNVSLDTVTLSDTLTDANGDALTLTSGPTLVAASDTGADGILSVDEEWTYSASFALTQQAIDAGGLSNTATASALDAQGAPVSDVSDDDAGATDSSGDGSTDNDPTLLPLPTTASLDVQKVADTSGLSTPAAVDDVVSFTITVTNTGNQTLSSPVLLDTFLDGNGTAIALRTGPSLQPGGDADEDGDLDVGEVWTYAADYALDQDAIDSASLSNSATMTATAPDGSSVSDDSDDDAGASDGNGDGNSGNDPTQVPLPVVASLDVQKSLDASAVQSPAQLDDTVTFQIVVTNTGNQTLDAPDLSDDLRDADGVALALTTGPTLAAGGDADGDGDLDVGEVWTYTASFDLTQQAIDAEGLSNSATMTATAPDGSSVEDVSDDDNGATDGNTDGDAGNDPVTTALTGAPGLAVVKTASLNDGGDGRVDAGDVVTFTYTVSNTGNQTLYDVNVTETGFGGTGTAPTPAYASGGSALGGDAAVMDLPVGTGTVVFTATYALEQGDIDAGEIANQGTAAADDPDGVSISDASHPSSTTDGDDAPTELPLTREPALQTVKQAFPALSTPAQVGDDIFYTITVANIGNVTLTDPTVADTLTLANGDAAALTQTPDYVSGDLDTDGVLDVGETWAYSAAFEVTQDAIDAGGVSNTALASANDPTNTAVTDQSDDTADNPADNDSTDTALSREPKLALVKSSTLDLGSDGVASVGDEITYTYVISNLGNVTLFDVAVTETAFGGAGAAPTPVHSLGGAALGGDAAVLDLPVGTETITFTAIYALTQDDIDAGGVSNQATATADGPDGTEVSDLSDDDSTEDGAEDPTQTSIPRAPGLNVVKTADTSGLASPVVPGNQIIFEIQVANTGNVTLDNVAVADTFTRRDGTVLSLTPALISGDAGTAGELEVGETWIYRATYALLQEDIDAGGVENTASVTALDPTDTELSDVSDDGDDTDGNDVDDPTVVNVGGEPSITMVKRLAAGAPDPFNAVDQVIPFEFEVTNTGNITLTDPITIDDPLIAAQGTDPVSCPAPPVAPGASIVCTGSYMVTQDDLDTGSITNLASANLTQTVQPVNPGDPTEVTTSAGPDSVTVNATQSPDLTLAKAVAATSQITYEAVGDQVTFDFTITNSGNVTIAGPLTVNDDLIGNGLACADGPLAVGDSITCSHIWTADQDDIDAGSATNTATGLGSFGGDTVESDPEQATVTAVQEPELSFEKTLTSATPNLFDEGTVLAYQFVVTNTGNTRIDGPITINDPTLTSTSCPALAGGQLDPTQSVTCTGEYTLQAGDIALGSFTNVASATGTFGGDPVTSPSDDAIYPVDATPALTLTKDSDPSDVTFATLGQEITYSYTVVNNSSVGFTEDITITDDKFEDTIPCYDASEEGILNVGESHTCTAIYEVTQDDLDAEQVTNEAFASTVFAPGTPYETAVQTPPATKTVPGTPDPELTLAKVISDAPAEAGLDDPIEFTLTATNTGNQTIAGVVISDPMLPELTCTIDAVPAPANVVLAPGDALVCVGTYEVTQDDLDAQTLVNAATVRGADPDGEDITSEATVPVTLEDDAPAFTLDKAILPAPAEGQPAFTAADQVVQFRVTAVNTGNVTIENVVITDQRTVTPTSCNIATLAVGASDSSCLFSYVTTQDDVNALNGTGPVFGGFTNVVDGTATAATPDATPATATDDVFVRGPDHAPAMSMEKSADVSEVARAGDTITYSYLVTNTGNITLTDPITVTDDKIANVSCPALPDGGLPLLGQITCEATYEVTQPDIDSGGITNVASAFSDEAPVPATPGAETDTLTIPATSDPVLTLVKTADDVTEVVAGQVVTYTYTLSNGGNTTLANLSVSDAHSSASGTSALTTAEGAISTDAAPTGDSVDATADGAWDSLAPGDSVTFTASYTVTQDDIDQQVTLTNTATVTATNPDGSEITNTDTLSVTPDPAAPAVSAIKTADASGLSAAPMAGEVVTFAISATNSGNQTLDTVSLNDILRRNDGTQIALASPPVLTGGDTGSDGIMGLGETWTWTASHALTQEDIDAGGVSNQVQVNALSPDDSLVSGTSDDGVPGNGDTNPAIVTIPAMPGLEAQKTVTSGDGTLNSTLEFAITVTNTGNVTLTSVGIASDTLTRADGTVLALTSGPSFVSSSQSSGAGTLLPDEVATYRATYTIQQADIDAGGVSNTATATGTPPVGSALTDVSDDGDDSDGNTASDPTEFEITPTPSVTLAKTLAATETGAYSTLGETLDFEFVVTNAGNVTLTEAISVSDPLIEAAGGAVTCPDLPAGGLIPGAQLTCTGSYAVTQDDLDTGTVTNTATATSGTSTTEPASETATALQMPAMEITKTPDPMEAVDFVTGAIARYTYVVTNTGNVTLEDAITVTDSLIPATDISCPAYPDEGLAPGGTYTCTATYTVTATDVDLGSVTNLATASDGTITSPITSATIPNQGVPVLSIDKNAPNDATFSDVGDTIDYTFVVTNSGTRAFASTVTVEDTLLGSIDCFVPSTENPDLVATEQATCSAQYTVTQDDLDRGYVLNEAFAETTFGADDQTISSPPDSVRVDADLTPDLLLSKTAATLPVTTVGQVLTYTLTASNAGNQTLRNIEIRDPMLAGFTCTTDLLPRGEELTCSGTYTVQQSDIDTGPLENSAVVSGLSPQGTAISETAVLVVDMPPAAPALRLTKTATPDPFGPAGTTLTYLFAVENTGNVTLRNVTVTDPMVPGYSCLIETLAPGTENTTCTMAYEVLQSDVDAGSISNTAAVAGTDPFDTPTNTTGTANTPGPDRVPSLVATKVLLPSVPVLGAPVEFQLSVENTGNVTLSNLSIDDQMQTLTGQPIALDAPFALSAASDTNANGRLDVGETWIYTAQHTLVQTDLNAGGISNQVTVSATDPTGAPVSDVSDNGIDGDGNTTDDATVFAITGEPRLNVVKSVQSSGTLPGETVVFQIAAQNIGNQDLNGLSVSDNLARSDGTPLDVTPVEVSVPAVLSPGAIATWTVTHTLTQDDIDAGGLRNSASVTGAAPNGSAVTDVSADDDATDGNTADDPTEAPIAPAPALRVVKTVIETGTQVGEAVQFEIAVSNTGNVTLTDIAVIDTVTDLDGAGSRGLDTTFVETSDGSPEGTLPPGETATYTASATLTLADIDSGGLSNTATASGATPQGGSLIDVSDNDGTGDDDPTIAPVTPLPSFEVVKTASEPSFLFPTVNQVTFTINVTNTGNLTQTGIQVRDDLVAFLAPAQLLAETYPLEVSATGFANAEGNADFDGSSVTELLAGDATLAPGETGTVGITMVYSTAAGQPGSPNTASVTSDQLPTPATGQTTLVVTDRDGDGVPDDLESATEDRDGDGIPDREDFDPTGYFYCEEDGRILTGGLITVTGNGFSQTGIGTAGPIVVTHDGSTGYYQFHTTAPGVFTMSLSYPPFGVPSTTRTSLGTIDATTLLPANPASIGSSEAGSTELLANFTAAANPFYHVFDIQAGDPFVINNNFPLMNCQNVPDVVATKTADRSTMVAGETVNFTLTFRNDTTRTYTNARIIDMLPAGLIYTPGSAVVNGTPQNPTVSGRQLSWVTTLNPSQTITVTLAARALRSGTFGPMTNRTWIENALGRPLSNVATATVRLMPEHTFDCSDVIGKVFDDKNGNGYQDGPNTQYEPIIDDSIYDAGKAGKGGKLAPAEEQPNLTEPGLPGVRLVTPDGLIVTTDANGLFSVPCAALPRNIGSNFQLKLDPRSLPTGYRVTTENPRVVRLTAGKMAKMNFGAALGKGVDIDLTDAAFLSGQTAPKPQLATAVDQLLDQIKTTPSTLRLTYMLAKGESPDLGRQRLREMEKLIRDRWRGKGSYRLIIQRTVVRRP